MDASQSFILKENGQEGVIQNLESFNICVEILYRFHAALLPI